MQVPKFISLRQFGVNGSERIHEDSLCMHFLLKVNFNNIHKLDSVAAIPQQNIQATVMQMQKHKRNAHKYLHI